MNANARWLALVLLATASGCCDRLTSGGSGGGASDEGTDPVITTKPPATFVLSGPSANQVLATTYPKSDVRLELAIRYSAPGVVLDTVGINAAAPGSFSLMVNQDGTVQFQVYDPKTISPVKAENGWHILTSKGTLERGALGFVVVEFWKGDVALWLNGKLEKRTSLEHTKLSGDKVYLGDFPGDDSWGTKYNIHPGMTGSVSVAYFGTLEPKTYRADRQLDIQ